MIEQIVKFQIKNAKILLFLLLVIIISAGFIATELKVNPDFGTLIPDDSQYNKNDRILKKAFETDNAVVLYLSIDDKSTLKNIPTSMREEKITSYIENLREVLLESQYVTNIYPAQYSDDNRAVQVIITLNTPEKVGGIGIAKGEMEFLINQVGTPLGVKKIITGFPIIIDRIPTLLITDNLNTILITLIAIFLILYWYSKNFYFTLITIATPLSSIILLAALMVILKIDVTITLAAVGVLVLGLGADYAIHISTNYLKARKEHEDHKQALIHTIKHLSLPITASFITTLAGFIALMFGISPSSQAQGIVLGLAITIIFFTTILLFPILITIFSKQINVKPNKYFEKILSSLGKLAQYQVKHSKAVIWLIVIITTIMIYGASKVQFSTSNSNWIPDSDEISKSFREVIYNFGGNSDSLDIVLISNKGDLRDVQVARDISILKSKLKSISNVETITSPYDNLNFSSNQIFEQLTYNPQLRNQFNHDWTLTKIKIITQNPGRDDSGKSLILKEIKEILKKTNIHNTKISLYGNGVRFNELGDALQKDTGVTTAIGLILVFFVTTTIYASFAIGILSLVPITIGLVWTVGFMGFFNVPFTSLSTGIISLVLGIGIDFSIHLVDSIKTYSKKMRFELAVFETMNTSGKAIFLSSLTTFVGFLALTFAKLLGTQRLGFSLAFSIVSVFIVTILFVPAILSLLNKREIRKKYKQKKQQI